MQLLLLTLLLFTAVVAQDEGEDEGEAETLSKDKLRSLFRLIDRNEDGKLSMKELLNFTMDFQQADSSKDTDEHVRDHDNDHDGKLSLIEVLKGFDEHDPESSPDSDMVDYVKRETKKFHAADRNGDGVLDTSEIPSYFHSDYFPEVLMVSARENVRIKDLDGDGKLSKEEFYETEHDGSFNTFDRNHDDFLDAEEFAEWESGFIFTKQDMKELMDVVDRNGDRRISEEELVKAQLLLGEVSAHATMLSWAEHHEL